MSGKAPPDAAGLTLNTVKDCLSANASGTERQKLLRYGIPNDCAIGVATGQMLAFTHKRPKDAELVTARWADGGYEMRTLALLLDDPARLTLARLDAMVWTCMAREETFCRTCGRRFCLKFMPTVRVNSTQIGVCSLITDSGGRRDNKLTQPPVPG